MHNNKQLDIKPSPKVWVNKKELDSKIIYYFVKRLIDILGSLVGLLILCPIFILVAYKIKREEPEGPVFFSQNRVGKNGKSFKMYKFRSMFIDAEEKLEQLLKYNEIEGAMFKMKDDPRITKVGKTIRKYSIDELPQLWNVLKGDMSLVGPRPPLPREVDEYSAYDIQRLLVKPGCTGLWQVNGRNDVDFHDMVELDLKYIINQSILYDIKIILKTVIVMMKPDGAY
ncbi:sugar transferase [Enterococcus casseliflavus]|uniref:sugar transferase n=1 Tax=Enterococcus casseliflavus TaxID=37734 RepID=UPI001433298E|nr:sugar transferase [Enterococcus casseliflavus]NKD37693.1 sugar transferase [Enterococcus casseliflavus]